MKQEYSDVVDPGEAGRWRAIRRVLWVTLCLNLAVAAIKLLLGWWSHSLAVTTDAFHSLLDGCSNIVALVGIWMAAQPPDENHPYGHRKFETLSALVLSGLLLLTCWEILKVAVRRIYEPSELPVFSWATVAVLVFTMGFNWFISWYEKREGERHRSMLLLADAIHTRTDIYVSGVAIAALLSAKFHLYWLDPFAALTIVALILRASYRMLHEAFMQLSDAAQLDPERVRTCAMGVPGVGGVHKIRTHGIPTDIHVDLHLELPVAMTSVEAMKVEDLVSDALVKEFPGVTYVGIRHQPMRADTSVASGG